MITFEIFNEQRNQSLSNKESLKKLKKDKINILNYDVFYFLLKNKYKNPTLILQKFTINECTDGVTFLKYKLSSFRKNRKDKTIPILEEIKFKELVLDMPDDSSGSFKSTAEFCLSPSGIIIDEIFGDKRQVKTPNGEYNNIRRFKLLIPHYYFKKLK